MDTAGLVDLQERVRRVDVAHARLAGGFGELRAWTHTLAVPLVGRTRASRRKRGTLRPSLPATTGQFLLSIEKKLPGWDRGGSCPSNRRKRSRTSVGSRDRRWRATIACCSPHRGAIAGRRKGAARLRRPVGGPRAKTEGRGGHAGNSTSQEENQVPKPSR